MQEEKENMVDIDTSGPEVEVELPTNETMIKRQEKIKHMKTNVKQNLKTIISPMIQIRNLISCLMFQFKKIKDKKVIRKN